MTFAKDAPGLSVCLHEGPLSSGVSAESLTSGRRFNMTQHMIGSCVRAVCVRHVDGC